MIQHFYKEIPGMFDPEDFENYRRIVAGAPVGATLVEIGCHCGYSTSFLLIEALNSGKNLNVVAIDNESESWKSSHPLLFLKQKFTEHGVYDKIRIINGDSAEAASLFDDGSVYFVFVDGDHTYSGCKRDLDAWIPKIQPGGIIAGHDYKNGGSEVHVAVNETFGRKNYIVKPKCWWEKQL